MRLKIYLLVIGLIGLALGLVAPALAQEGQGDAARGAELYAANCAVCHGDTGEGRVGATLSDVFVTLDADALLEGVISQGRPDTFMPAWGQAYGGPLTEAEVQDIIAYIKSWGATYEPPVPPPQRPPLEIPPVPQVDGDPNLGYTIFQENCAACHGEGGEGRIGATLTTAFAAIEPGAFTIETVRRGVSGSLMPPFGQAYGGPLTNEEINHVAAYVLSIQGPARPPRGEVVQRGSVWPLLIVIGVSLVIVVAIARALERRQAKKADSSGEK